MAMAHPTSNFLIPDHDFQAHTGMTANHGPLAVEYRRGGPTGEVVATEAITYDGNNQIATRHITWSV